MKVKMTQLWRFQVNSLFRVLMVTVLMQLVFGNTVFAEGARLPFYNHLAAATHKIYRAKNEAKNINEAAAVANIAKHLQGSILEYNRAIDTIEDGPANKRPKSPERKKYKMRELIKRIETIRFMLVNRDRLSEIPQLLERLYKDANQFSGWVFYGPGYIFQL